MKQLCMFVVLLLIYKVNASNISEQKCKEYSELTRKAREIDDLTNGWFYLPGKVPTAKGEFPHMVKLGYEHDENDTRRITWGCGGTLISDQFVLTTATCRMFGSSVLFQRRSLRKLESRKAIPANLELPPDDSPIKFVKLGDQTTNEQTLTVEEIILHPNMSSVSFYNDIALLKLSEKVNFTEFVHPACLYSSEDDLENKTLTASGWGLLGVGHYFSDDLMKLDLTVFSQEKCKEEYRTMVNSSYLREGVVDTLMCVGAYDQAKALCPGDGGGPFQMKNTKYPNMYDVVGVTTFGYYCNLIKISTLVTRVAPFVPWIESVVWNKDNLIF